MQMATNNVINSEAQQVLLVVHGMSDIWQTAGMLFQEQELKPQVEAEAEAEVFFNSVPKSLPRKAAIESVVEPFCFEPGALWSTQHDPSIASGLE